MADRIITVTDPSVVTNDTLAGYNNYSDQDGQLGTTMTPTEATNGHTVTLSDGVVHQVTSKPVGTTNGEFSAVVSNAVEVDLTVSASFGLQLRVGVGGEVAYFGAFDTPTGDFYIESAFTTITHGAGQFIGMDLGTTIVGYFGINYVSGTNYKLDVRDGTTLSSGNVAIVDGDVVRINRTGDVWTILINGVAQGTPISAPTFTNTTNKNFSFKGSSIAGTNGVTRTIYDIDFNGETGFLTEGSGATSTGGSGTVLTLVSADGVDNMWLPHP